MKNENENEEENLEQMNRILPFPDPGAAEDAAPPEDAVDLCIPPHHLDQVQGMSMLSEAWKDVDSGAANESYHYMAQVLRKNTGENIDLPDRADDLDHSQKIKFTVLAGLMPNEVQDRIAIYSMACLLYEIYCISVGGVAFNGDALPSWDEFAGDPDKQAQAGAWLEVGRIACCLKFGGYHRGAEIGAKMVLGTPAKKGGEEG